MLFDPEFYDLRSVTDISEVAVHAIHETGGRSRELKTCLS